MPLFWSFLRKDMTQVAIIVIKGRRESSTLNAIAFRIPAKERSKLYKKKLPNI